MIDLPDFSEARVLVAGDLMLDRYWYGPTGRISPEAPVPVVRVDEAEERPGGAANVALNLGTLGARVCLLGLVGEDASGRGLERALEVAGVECCFQPVPGFPTITKLRVLSRHQQLIRLDFENGFPAAAGEGLMATFRRQAERADVVVLSDYAKGTLADPRPFIEAAQAVGRPVLVDPKRRDFSLYRGADLVTPNLAELEAVVGPCPDEDALLAKGRALLATHDLGALLVTRGEKGMTLLQPGQPARHMPAQAREVYDVTGAGDTVISVLAAGLAAGMPLPTATQLANQAAGVVVGKLGTAPVTRDELRAALAAQHGGRRGAVDEPGLLELCRAARARGETLVFTNGCFDILHAGHVTYLEQASRLGDRLIVAVNEDATVRDLKGADRPVNPLADRMTVLAALACVDWVVPFAEPTPERLICALRPHLLVKGGDNDPAEIPGGDCVRRAGGEVRVLDYVPDRSTTAIIQAIRGR